MSAKEVLGEASHFGQFAKDCDDPEMKIHFYKQVSLPSIGIATVCTNGLVLGRVLATLFAVFDRLSTTRRPWLV